MNTKVQIGIVLLVVMLLALPLAVNLKPAHAVQSPTETKGDTYNLVSLAGKPVPCPGPGDADFVFTSGSTITMNNDGMYAVLFQFAKPGGGTFGVDFNGTYTKEGSDCTLDWTEKTGKKLQVKVTIDGSTLTMTDEGILYVFQKMGAGTTSASSK
jgi:hypothetical protein